MNTKILGILGGMSWVSTQSYYQHINEGVNRSLGQQNSAHLLISSLNFQEIVDAQVRKDWQQAANILSHAAKGLEHAGANAWLIASNTMHLSFNQVQASVNILGLSIFDATANEAKRLQLFKLGLLGTRYTMSKSNSFFIDEYRKRGIEIILPNTTDGTRINEIIFRELIHNKIREESRTFYLDAVARLADQGAAGVILGCTEIDLLLNSNAPSPVPLLSTTQLHCNAAVKWLLES